MKFSLHSLSIRARLLLLVMAIVLPVTAIASWYISIEAEEARKGAYAQVKVLAEDAAADITNILHDNEAVLSRLAERPLVQALDAKRCDPILAEYSSLHPEFSTLAVRDAHAALVCTLVANAPGTEEVRQTPWFQEIMTSGRFTAGNATKSIRRGLWVSISAFPIRDQAGRIAGVVFFSNDLLKLSRKIFSAVPKSALVGVIDGQGKILLRSIDPEQWIGRLSARASRAEAAGEGSSTFYTARDSTGVQRLYASALVPGVNWRVYAGLPEDEVLAQSRAVVVRSVWLGLIVLALLLVLVWRLGEAIAKPIRGLAATAEEIARGSSARAQIAGPVEVMNVAQQLNRMLDVREQVDKALRESERRFSTVFQSSPIGMVLTRFSDGKILEINDAAVRLLGYSREEALGNTTRGLGAWVDEGERDRMANMVRDQGRVDRFEALLRHRSGTILRIAFSGCVIMVGEEPCLIGMMSDITEQKRLEEARLQSQKLESLGTLAGGIAHDFNNILTAIRGNAYLATKDVGPNHPALESLQEIEKAGERAKDLVRRIMAFGRPREPHRELVDMPSVVQEVLKLLRSTLSATIELRTHFAAGIPRVQADAAQVHEAIVNLTTNAAHAIGSNTGSIEYGLETADLGAAQAAEFNLPAGQYLRLSVKDSGCGMDDGTKTRIFDAFFTTKPVGKGTGLGLAMVHGIVKSHGGAIDVDSAPGEGSSFQLYFPVATEESKLANEAMPPPFLLSAGKRVLYVDDEEALVSLGKRLLTRFGHKVSGFGSPKAALETFLSHPDDYDVVITDLAMPQMSGIDLARQLLAIRPDIPVLMLTGNTSAEDEVRVRDAGIRELIHKPVTVEGLVQAIERLFPSSSPDSVEAFAQRQSTG